MNILKGNRNINKYSIYKKSKRSPPLIEKAVDELCDINYVIKTGQRKSKTNKNKLINLYSLSKKGFIVLMDYRTAKVGMNSLALPSMLYGLRNNYPEYLLDPISNLSDGFFILLYPHLSPIRGIDYNNISGFRILGYPEAR